MMSHTFRILRVSGIDVRVHWTWLILAFLVASSLATGWFPVMAPGQTTNTYWSGAVFCSAGLFFSIVVHEFCHAIVGRAFKMPVEKITLFLFGGVAHLDDEPPNARSEFWMAIAGPAASVVLAFGFYGLQILATQNGSPLMWQAGLNYLASINIVVAAFNMLPGFPMDGGRVLRSLLWGIKGNMLWATKVASNVGQIFGGVLIALGLITLFRGAAISGIWGFTLGFLVIGFARASFIQLLVKKELQGRPAVNFMDPLPVTCRPETSVSDLMRGVLNRSETANGEAVVPVIGENCEYVGCANLRAAQKLPEREWSQHQVREIIQPLESDHLIDPDTDAEKALTQMTKKGYRELLIIRGNRLVGVLTQAALSRYLSLRQNQAYSS